VLSPNKVNTNAIHKRAKGGRMKKSACSGTKWGNAWLKDQAKGYLKITFRVKEKKKKKKRAKVKSDTIHNQKERELPCTQGRRQRRMLFKN